MCLPARDSVAILAQGTGASHPGALYEPQQPLAIKCPPAGNKLLWVARHPASAPSSCQLSPRVRAIALTLVTGRFT